MMFEVLDEEPGEDEEVISSVYMMWLLCINIIICMISIFLSLEHQRIIIFIL